MNPLIQLRKAAPVFLVALVCVGLLPTLRAVSPAPDGGYSGGNTAEGKSALLSLTTGGFNTAVGFFSLRSNTTGQLNTAIGAGTLLVNTADQNTATGAGALLSNTIGAANTANGAFTLFSNTTGNGNTANGAQALQHNTTGNGNTANGAQALFINTTGASNTATGSGALALNLTGGDNTANGAQALFNNSTGTSNTANGAFALSSNTGSFNTATGGQALQNNTTGGSNTATGANALVLNTTGSDNTAIGISAGINITTASNVICIGAVGANVSGSCFIGQIWNQPGGSQAVYVNSDGKLGALVSSKRFKEEIKPMSDKSKALFALNPVAFRYRKEIDPAGTPQLGLVAEDVEKVSPDLVVRDKEGKPYSVRYDQVNAMLLNEFLKEHKKVEKLEATVAQQHKDFEAAVAELKGQIQKVSTQLELSKAAPQTVLNDQ